MLKPAIILILSSNLFAQVDKEAKIKNPIKDENVAQYGNADYASLCSAQDSYSLYDDGNTLENVKQQDQDGLATCYANSTSLLLKSHNPELPVPSYLNLAGLDKKTDEDDKMPFNYGYSCRLLNPYIQDLKEHEVAKIELCEDGIIENQSSTYQQDLLEKLYTLLDKKDVSRERFSEMYDYYKSLREKNDKATRECNLNDTNLSSYTLNESFNFYDQWYYQDKTCGEKIQKIFLDKGILIKNKWDGLEVTPEFESMLSQHSYDYMQSQKINEKTYAQTYLDYINTASSLTDAQNQYLDQGAPFAKKENFNVSANKKIQVMGENLSKEFYKFFVEFLPKDNEAINTCLSQLSADMNKYRADSFFSGISLNCFKENQDSINKTVNHIYGACSETDQSIFEIFRSLEYLGSELEDIQNFVLAKESSPLLNIIKPYCKKKNTYQIQGSACNQISTTKGFAELKSIDDWYGLKEFNKDLEKFLELNDSFNYSKFLKFLGDKYNKQEYLDNQKSEDKDYIDFLIAMNNQYSSSSNPSKETLQFMIKDHVKTRIKEHKDSAKNIVQELKKGHAVPISTCGSMYKDSEKQNYPNCKNHSVTATGYKCVNGQLKIEMTNSWGIDCTEDKSKLNLFECQKDSDGITNGRSWVDFNYMSNQGIRYNIIK